MPKSPTYQKAPVPLDEKERLRSLRALRVLDTPPEERYDRITRLALSLFTVPISTITLIDSHREWFKSCQGLPTREGERAISFCGHAMLADDVFVVPDAKKDPLFMGNPMVVGKPYIRFYAAVPLRSADGKRVGAFCIKDYSPRTFSKKEHLLLTSLGVWVELELNTHELSRALEARRQAEEKVSEFNEILRLLNKILRHDILNNLTVMKGNIELYLRGKRDEGRLINLYDVIDRSASLITQMSKLESSVSAGKPLTPYPLRELVDEVCRYFPSMQCKVVGRATVLADQALISVIENIMRNAKIHGKTDKIAITIKEKRDFVEMIIADQGIGIPHPIKNSLFQEGFRYGETGHIGLGLYIVKKTIERYGGKITIKDHRPKGTAFIIKLPHYRTPPRCTR